MSKDIFNKISLIIGEIVSVIILLLCLIILVVVTTIVAFYDKMRPASSPADDKTQAYG